MNLFLIAPWGSNKKRTIVGRGIGSGLGKTSGRGHKGQKARPAGTKGPLMEGGQMPLHRRLPIRGFSNARFRKPIQVVSLDRIYNAFEEKDTVNLFTLFDKGLVKSLKQPVKIILPSFPIENVKALSFDLNRFSKGAKASILGAKGTIN